MIRLLQPNNSLTEYTINKRIYDDKGDVVETLNNVSKGKYDVILVPGSTLPTNRYAQLEMYMDAYKNGIIDRIEVLKKTEVFDIEGVLKRTDEVDNLKQQLEQAQENIKKLEGDLQTREREVYHAKQQAELAKFKASLDSTSNKAKAAETVYSQGLSDSQKNIEKEVGQQEQATRRLESKEEALDKKLKDLNRDKPSKKES